jgi:hypothetical protein
MAKKETEPAPRADEAGGTPERAVDLQMTQLFLDILDGDPDFLEELENPTPKSNEPPTDEALALIASSGSMVARMARVIGRSEYNTRPEPTAPSRRWNLEPRHVAFCESMIGGLDRLAASHHMRIQGWEARHVTLDDLRDVVRHAILAVVNELKDQALTQEARCWSYVDIRLRKFIAEEAAYKATTNAGIRLANDFAERVPFDEDEPADWVLYDDGAWSFAAAFVVGAATATLFLRSEPADVVLREMGDLRALSDALWKTLSAEDQHLISARARGFPYKSIARHLDRDERELREQVYRALASLGAVLRRHSQREPVAAPSTPSMS